MASPRIRATTRTQKIKIDRVLPKLPEYKAIERTVFSINTLPQAFNPKTSLMSVGFSSVPKVGSGSIILLETNATSPNLIFGYGVAKSAAYSDNGDQFGDRFPWVVPLEWFVLVNDIENWVQFPGASTQQRRIGKNTRDDAFSVVSYLNKMENEGKALYSPAYAEVTSNWLPRNFTGQQEAVGE